MIHTIRYIHIIHIVGDGVKDSLKFFRAVPVGDIADTLQDLEALGNFLDHIDRHGSERFVQPLATLKSAIMNICRIRRCVNADTTRKVFYCFVPLQITGCSWLGQNSQKHPESDAAVAACSRETTSREFHFRYSRPQSYSAVVDPTCFCTFPTFSAKKGSRQFFLHPRSA
jgi:hypothetical protein